MVKIWSRWLALSSFIGSEEGIFRQAYALGRLRSVESQCLSGFEQFGSPLSCLYYCLD